MKLQSTSERCGQVGFAPLLQDLYNQECSHVRVSRVVANAVAGGLFVLCDFRDFYK